MNPEHTAPGGAAFLSYAREDAHAAQGITEALRAVAVGIDTDL